MRETSKGLEGQERAWREERDGWVFLMLGGL